MLGSPQTQTFTYDALNRLKSAGSDGTSGRNGAYSTENYDYDLAGRLGQNPSVGAYAYNNANHLHAVTHIGSSTQNITIRAKGSQADNVYPTMELRVNGLLVQSWTVNSTAYTNYVANNVQLTGKDMIDVVFTNDAMINGNDRNLWVDYIEIGITRIESNASGVIYDRYGPYDGIDTIAGQEYLYAAGSLCFTFGTASAEYTYDANGNQIQRVIGANTYNLAYNAENRLVSVSGAASNTYVYDGDGNRVKETTYENLAAGMPVVGSTTLVWAAAITDGDNQPANGRGASGEFGYIGGGGLRWVTVDLGAAYNVDKIKVWHYYLGGRTYHNTKTQVSADGVTWHTVFDSATAGEYAETAAGKTHTFTARSVRYVRDYLNGSTANASNHWAEIEVYGSRILPPILATILIGTSPPKAPRVTILQAHNGLPCEPEPAPPITAT